MTPDSKDDAELLAAYDQTGRLLKVGERKLLLREMREYSQRSGDAPFAVETVFLMLVSSSAELYVVQRAQKTDNPWLLDKTVGGHVTYGESPASTLLREADEEIGVAVVLTTRESARDTIANLDTSRLAVAWEIAFDPWLESIRVVAAGEPWRKRHRATIYAGRYDGPVTFKDGEAASMEKIPLAAFPEVYAARRSEFTHDLGVLLERWWDRLRL
jgi:ADP-ribose pyrophosphatase YjhB (NUDIX family)